MDNHLCHHQRDCLFTYPHQATEFVQYEKFIISQLAEQSDPSQHFRVLDLDRAIRLHVTRSNDLMLTSFNWFNDLIMNHLFTNPVHMSFKQGGIKCTHKFIEPNAPVCLHWNNGWCTSETCWYRHICHHCFGWHQEKDWVMSHNTPVTLLTNFQLVLDHTVTSIRIPRFPELRFRTRTWMQSIDTTHHDIIVMSCHFRVLWITEVLHPRPYLLFIVKLSRTGFLTWLKCKKVRIVKGKMSRMIVKEKLSERAVMKEDRLGWVCLQERRLTPKGT